MLHTLFRGLSSCCMTGPADYGSYRSASVHIQPQLVVQELLTVAAFIYGLPDSLCVALIGKICSFLCEKFFCQVLSMWSTQVCYVQEGCTTLCLITNYTN